MKHVINSIINLYIDSIMKKMSATEEKSFIESGQSDQLFDYIVLNQLHGVNVPKFFELATAPTVKYYLRHYGLSQDNEIELLKTQNLSYLEVYFEMYPLSLKSIEVMFELKNPNIVGEYIRYHELPQDYETMLFTPGFEKQAMFYVSHNLLYSTSEVPMMNFGGAKMVECYIEHNDLHQEAELLLFSPQFESLVNKYLRKWCFSPVARKRYDEWIASFSNEED